MTIGYGIPTQVMSLTAPVSGTYYVSSSFEVLLSQNSDYGCLINYTQDVHLAGPYSMTNYSTMALDSSVSVTAGSPIIVTCMTYLGTATFQSGSINAILVGSSNGTTNTVATAKSPPPP